MPLTFLHPGHSPTILYVFGLLWHAICTVSKWQLKCSFNTWRHSDVCPEYLDSCSATLCSFLPEEFITCLKIYAYVCVKLFTIIFIWLTFNTQLNMTYLEHQLGVWSRLKKKCNLKEWVLSNHAAAKNLLWLAGTNLCSPDACKASDALGRSESSEC